MTFRFALPALACVAFFFTSGASPEAQAPATVTPVTDATLQNPDQAIGSTGAGHSTGGATARSMRSIGPTSASSSSPGPGVSTRGFHRPPRSCTTA